MKRRPTFLIGFVAAALTFASLMIFAGPQRFNAYGFSHSLFHGGERQSHCRQERHQADEVSRTQESVTEEKNSNNK